VIQNKVNNNKLNNIVNDNGTAQFLQINKLQKKMMLL